MKRHLNNILYSVSIIGRESKWYVVLNILMTFENIPRRFLDVWIIEYIVTQAVVGAFNKILYASLGYFFYCLVVIVVKKTFEECYKKPEEEKIRQSIKMNLYEKMASFDIAVYDDTEFYNKYVMAFSMVEKKGFEIFNRLILLLGAIISIGTLFSVIMTISPFIVAFSLIGSLITVLSNFYMSKINYHKEQEIVLKNRILAYINRIYYQQQYSKDVRLENLHEFLIEKFKESGLQKRAILKKYGKKNVGASVISEGAMSMADVGMWIYIGRGIVNGTLQAGSFMALSNAAWSLSNQIRRLFNNFPQLYQDSLFIENIRIFESYVPKVSESNTTYPIDRLAVKKLLSIIARSDIILKLSII